MASIGGTSCTFVRGCAPPMKIEADVWRVAGLNGFGIQQLGYGDAAGKLTAVFYSSDAGVDTWAAALHALQGTIVTVVNDHGDSRGDVFLARLSELVKTSAYQPGTGVTTRGQIEIDTLTTL